MAESQFVLGQTMHDDLATTVSRRLTRLAIGILGWNGFYSADFPPDPIGLERWLLTARQDKVYV